MSSYLLWSSVFPQCDAEGTFSLILFSTNDSFSAMADAVPSNRTRSLSASSMRSKQSFWNASFSLVRSLITVGMALLPAERSDVMCS